MQNVKLYINYALGQSWVFVHVQFKLLPAVADPGGGISPRGVILGFMPASTCLLLIFK
jgi:hypothetical protein